MRIRILLFHHWPSSCHTKKLFKKKFCCILLFESTVTSLCKDKKSKTSHRTVEIKIFLTIFCLMIEGSGSRSIPLTDGSGSGSKRPHNMWIRLKACFYLKSWRFLIEVLSDIFCNWTVFSARLPVLQFIRQDTENTREKHEITLDHSSRQVKQNLWRQVSVIALQRCQKVIGIVISDQTRGDQPKDQVPWPLSFM